MKLKNMAAGLLTAVVMAASSPLIDGMPIIAAEEQTYAILTLDGMETAPDEISEYGTPVYRIDGFEHTYKFDFPLEEQQEVSLSWNGDEKSGYICDISWDVYANFSGSIGFFDPETGNPSGGTRLMFGILDGNIGESAGGGVLNYYLGVEKKELVWYEEPVYIGPGSGTISFSDMGENTKTSIGFMSMGSGTIEFTIRKADQATDEPTEEPDTPSDPPEINYETGEDVKVTDYIPANGDTDTELHVISITKEQALNNPAYDVKATVTEKDDTKKSYTVRTENCYKGFAYNTADGKKTVTAENGYFIIVKINDLPDGSFVSVDITAVK